VPSPALLLYGLRVQAGLNRWSSVRRSWREGRGAGNPAALSPRPPASHTPPEQRDVAEPPRHDRSAFERRLVLQGTCLDIKLQTHFRINKLDKLPRCSHKTPGQHLGESKQVHPDSWWQSPKGLSSVLCKATWCRTTIRDKMADIWGPSQKTPYKLQVLQLEQTLNGAHMSHSALCCTSEITQVLPYNLQTNSSLSSEQCITASKKNVPKEKKICQSLNSPFNGNFKWAPYILHYF